MALDEQTKELFNPNDEEIEKFFKEVFKDKKAGDKISFNKICDSFYEKYKISFERKYLFKSFINLKSKNLNINFDICIKNDECLCVPDNNELKKFTINFLFANKIGKKINIEQAKTSFIQKYNFEEGWSSDIFCRISTKTFFEDTKEKSENLTTILKSFFSFFDLSYSKGTKILEPALKIANSVLNKYYIKYDMKKNEIKSCLRNFDKLVDKYFPACNEYFGDDLKEHILKTHTQNKYSIILANGYDTFCCKNCGAEKLYFWKVPEDTVINHEKGLCKNADF